MAETAKDVELLNRRLERERAAREHAEGLLLQAEQFRIAVEAAPSAMIMVDREGRITLVNTQTEKLFGYARDELMGHPIEMLVPADVRQHHPGLRDAFFANPKARAMGTGRDLNGVTKDGRLVPIEIGLNPVETPHGTAVLASIIDITERKRAEERIRLVVEAAPNAMIMVNNDGHITLVNAQTERMFGYTRAELIGQPIEMLVPADVRQRHPGLRDAFFANPQARSMGVGRDLNGLTKHGRLVPIEIGLNPVETGEGTFVLASIIDITERKRAEERIRLVVEAAPNAMIMVNQEGRITLVNAQTEKMFGYRRDELMGQPIEMLVPADVRKRHPGLRDAFFANPQARSMGVGRDLNGLTKHGRLVPIEIGLNPVETGEGTFVLASIIDITERKRAQDRIRLVVEAAPNAMLMMSHEGRITLVNAQTEKLFGYPRDELIGQPVEMLVPERHRQGHPGLRGAYFANPSTRSMGVGRDLFGLTKQGREVPIEIGLNPIETADGTFVLASIIDITERKRSQEAIRASDLRFRQMVSGVKDYAIIMLDAHGSVVSWNEGAQRLKGYSEPEIVGKHIAIFYPPQQVKDGKPDYELREAADHGRYEDEGWRVRKDGTQFWANVIITPMYDERGALTGYSKVTRDMTDRRRADERFRLAVEAAPNAMLMVNHEGRITLVNAQAEKMFGYTREQLIGQPLEILVPARARAGHPALRDKYIGKPSTRSMGAGRDLYGLTRDGREVPIEIGLNPMKTSEGTFVLASIIDITERKRAENALRELNQTLQRESAEKDEALANLRDAQDQLVQSEKLASLGGLVAGIAHEINTPIGIGVTAASYLRDEAQALNAATEAGTLKKSQLLASTRTFVRSAEMVLGNLGRAAELIESFKQVAVDRSSSERREVELGPYLSQVIMHLHPKLRHTQHKIELNCDPGLTAETVPGALSQILTNFVMNSLLHAFEGVDSGLIRIGVQRDGDNVVLTYGDNGRGIPTDVLPKIFDPFFTTRRGRGGTGLGLHVVFNLVHQALGGAIRASSTPGHGTEFVITFPIKRSVKETAP